MKVLVFTSLFPNNIWPNHGVFIKNRMSKVSTQEGVTIKVVAPVPYFPPIKGTHRWQYSQICQKEIIEGLEIHHPRYLMIPKVAMFLHGVMMAFGVILGVSKIRRDFDFDIIDAHYVYPDGLAAILLGCIFKKPVVVSARGSDINLFRKFPIVKKLVRYTLRQAKHVIAVSQALGDVMVEMGIASDKITVIPNGVDLEKFPFRPKKESRLRLGLPEKKMILSVGNLTPNKGFDVLIGAMKILLEKFQILDTYLVIVGEGSMRPSLEKMIEAYGLKDYVRLIGSVPQDCLWPWYGAADLFCLASEREGWPNVVLEALACGTPVVATAVGGISEIVRSENIGVLVSRTCQDFARAILEALNRPWDSLALRSYASEHTWDNVAYSVSHVFESLMKSDLEFPVDALALPKRR